MQLFNVQEIRLVYQSTLNALFAFFTVHFLQQLLHTATANSIGLKARLYFLKTDYVIKSYEWNYDAVQAVYFLPFLWHLLILILVAAVYFIFRFRLTRSMRLFFIWYLFFTLCSLGAMIAAGIIAKKEIYFFFSYFIYQFNMEAGLMYAFLGAALMIVLLSAALFRHSFLSLTHSLSFLEEMGTKKYTLFIMVIPTFLTLVFYIGFMFKALSLYELTMAGLVAFASFLLYFITPSLIMVKRTKAGLPKPNLVIFVLFLVMLISLRLFLRPGIVV